MKKMTLNGQWLARGGEFDKIEATVPGCIHTDLLNNCFIKDPYYRDNETDLMWIGKTDWTYEREFCIDDAFLLQDNIKLVCKGLDTFAVIRINDNDIAQTDNMFRAWEFEVKKYLKKGLNTIQIKFNSTYPYMDQKMQERWLTISGLDHHRISGSNYVRKMQCNYGWDWGPMCVTSGIWKDIELISYDNSKIHDIQVKQVHDKSNVDLKIITSLDTYCSDSPMKLRIDVSFKGNVVGSSVADVSSDKIYDVINIKDPHLWWPNNLGEQNLYDVDVFLLDENSEALDTRRIKIGLRTLELDTQEDKYGESFQFVVNGVPFFAKGANWIPIDTFVTRGTEDFYRQLLKDAKDANMNCIRVWGGGIYEQDVFYDLCDEYGLCVWQDFMFACSAYPVYDEQYLSTFKQEAIDNIIRIRNHPCLALWCGNNEIEHMGNMITEDIECGTMTWDEYKLLFEDIIPELIQLHDGEHDYWVSSPHTPGKNRSNPNDPTKGDAHLWNVWHGREPFEWYRTCDHRFNSEFGFQSFPEPDVVNSFTIEEDRNIASYVMEKHQRSAIGNDAIMQYMLSWFQMPSNFDMLLWTSQILQSLAIKYAVEHWRRQMPQGMGTIYWQLNDCWPVASWSSIDYVGNWKALHYSARHFFNPILISGVENKEASSVDLYLSNDTLETVEGDIVWKLFDLGGKLVATESFAAQIDANSSRAIKSLDLSSYVNNVGGLRNVVLFYSFIVDGKTLSENTTYFERPKHLKLQKPVYSKAVVKTDVQTFELTIKADKPSLWVWPELSNMKAKYSDRFFHLDGHDEKAITVYLEQDATVEDIESALKIYSIVDTYGK